MKNKIKNYQNKLKTGFTLAELIIVIAIMAVISTLVLFNNAKLNSSILLSNTAYEISLIIRDAQISGIGSKVRLENGLPVTYNQGVYIDSNNPEQVIFFADKDGNNMYTAISDEENQIYNIENKRAGKILSLCKLNPGDTVCSTSNVADINILFKRPNPEAYFYYFENGSATAHSGSIVLNIGFDGGDCKSIVIYKTGAIQIDKSFCPTI